MSGPRYFRVSPKFWRDARGWTDEQRIAALYLLTNEHRTTEGFYYLPLGYVHADLGYALETVETLWAFLESECFMRYDDDSQVVLVRNALKYQAPATKDQLTGAINRLQGLPKTPLWRDFRVACESHCPPLWSAIEVALPVALEYSSSSSFSNSSTGSGAIGESRASENAVTVGFDTARERIKRQAAQAATHAAFSVSREGTA